MMTQLHMDGARIELQGHPYNVFLGATVTPAAEDHQVVYAEPGEVLVFDPRE